MRTHPGHLWTELFPGSACRGIHKWIVQVRGSSVQSQKITFSGQGLHGEINQDNPSAQESMDSPIANAKTGPNQLEFDFFVSKIAKKYYYVFSNKSLYLRSQILFLHISTTISVVILVPKIAASTSSQGDPPHRTSLTLFPKTLANLQRPWLQWVSLHHPSLHRNEVELSGWMVEFSSLKITFHKNSRNQAPAPKCPCVPASWESV